MKTSSRFQAFLRFSVLAAAALGLAAKSGAQVTSYIASGTAWKILDNGTTPAANWKVAGFADGAWRSANSSFGYKVGGAVNNGATSAINFNTGNNAANPKWITTYFRKTFNPGAALPAALVIGARWDDGIIVYLNGVEIRRENMPAGAVDGTTVASGAIDVQAGPVSSTFIVQGVTMIANSLNNVIAVELHQAAATSSDVFFDLTLGGTFTVPCYGDAVVGVFQDFEAGVEPLLTPGHYGYLRAFDHTQLQFEAWTTTAPPTVPTFAPDTAQLTFGPTSSFVVETERVDTQNYQNIKASVQLRSNADAATSWINGDFIKATLFISNNGIDYTPSQWFNYTYLPLTAINVPILTETAPNFWMVPSIGAQPINGATNASPIVISSLYDHDFVTGDTVTISSVQGNTNANGAKVVTVLTTKTFSLNGTTGNGAYINNSGTFLRKSNTNTTTNPQDWMNVVPAGWTDYKTPPAPGVLTANFWRKGNEAAAVTKGGLGYDNTTTGGSAAPPENFTTYLDSGNSAFVKSEMFQVSPSFVGQTRLNMRIPFDMTGVDINGITKVELKARFDDALGAWINGVKLTLSGAPTEPATDTANVVTRSNSDNAAFTVFDITAAFKANAVAGPANILAVRGYNSTANNDDFLLQPTLQMVFPGPPQAGSTASLNLGGPMTTKDSALIIPNGTRSFKIKFEGTASGPLTKSYHIDNLKVTGDAIAAVDLGSTIALQLPVANYPDALRTPTADADGDGMSNLLEYSCGSNMAVSAQSTVLPDSTIQPYSPMISQNLDGTIQIRFRTLVGAVVQSELDNGAFDIKDMRYQPQRAPTGNYDWQSVNEFVVSAPTVSNDDGTQLVTISTTTPIAGFGRSQMFRIQVSNNQDPWLAPGVTYDTPICPFPETTAW